MSHGICFRVRESLNNHCYHKQQRSAVVMLWFLLEIDFISQHELRLTYSSEGTIRYRIRLGISNADLLKNLAPSRFLACF
jgi:hypothetical protein